MPVQGVGVGVADGAGEALPLGVVPLVDGMFCVEGIVALPWCVRWLVPVVVVVVADAPGVVVVDDVPLGEADVVEDVVVLGGVVVLGDAVVLG